MRISVIGAGYVGLVLGSCMAESGVDVELIDIDHDRVRLLNKGMLPLHEPGLKELVVSNLEAGGIAFTASYPKGLRGAQVAFVAVGTPPLQNGGADLSGVKAAAAEIARHAPSDLALVIKSTVPVGTALQVRQLLADEGRTDIEVISNPEFLREGRAVEDFLHPDRVVIGTNSTEAARLMKSLYRRFLESDIPIMVMDNASAEMTKYASNAFLATRISFVNEIANICDHVEANVDDVVRAMGADRRIGSHYLYPGCGYGGSCFPKDVQALINMANGNRYAASLLSSVHQTNINQKRRLGEKIADYFAGTLRGRMIGVWGLSFKENTDDVRESPSLTLIDYLIGKGARVQVFDPASLHRVPDIFPNGVTACHDQYDAVRDADALAVVTPWEQFRSPDWKRVKSLLKHPVVFDGRNLYDPHRLMDMGFAYDGFGRPNGHQIQPVLQDSDLVDTQLVTQG